MLNQSRSPASSAPELECEARRYCDALGYAVEWEAVGRLDDEMLVNGIAQIAPLDPVRNRPCWNGDIAGRADLLSSSCSSSACCRAARTARRPCNER
jgi:hypothetical protein